MTKRLWGSRFAKGTSILADRFSSSIAYDKRLVVYDVKGSIAHAKMLGRCKIIPKKDAAKIVKGLKAILREVLLGRFKFNPKAEDIHSNIQETLNRKIGAVADKLHTARSRNDQVVLDMKLYCLDEIDSITKAISELQKSVLKFADKNKGIIIPAYTHLQPAQCVLLAHHMLAYLEMLERDKSRLLDAKNRTDDMPLGVCALSGTSLNTDRRFIARQLGFSKVTHNSIDTVSDRDFIIELLADLTIISIHLSRISEDLILWSTKEFDFIEIDWSFCTGSSIMPHKKNPDILELIRATAGKIHGDFSSVVMMMKGLPLSYNRDMQFDKPALFDAVDTTKQILLIFKELFRNISLNRHEILKRLDNESLFSVDIVEYLIKKGLSYRQAHDVVGLMVRECLDKGKRISSLTLNELRYYSVKFEDDIKKILNARQSVNMKKSFGSTSPAGVNKQINKWKARLNE
jgi:argininosuccinate lyase